MLGHISDFPSRHQPRVEGSVERELPENLNACKPFDLPSYPPSVLLRRAASDSVAFFRTYKIIDFLLTNAKMPNVTDSTGAFTYDITKRVENLKKHDVDFDICAPLFNACMVSTVDDGDHQYDSQGEERIFSLGMMYGKVYRFVWVDRDLPQMIHCRRAKPNEERIYFKACFGC